MADYGHHSSSQHIRWPGGRGISDALVVRRPIDGHLIDIEGALEPKEFIADYNCRADDFRAAVGASSRAAAAQWYIKSQGEPIPISLAATFVDAVVRNPAKTDT